MPNKTRVCKGCEVEFALSVGGQYFCNKECQRRSFLATRHGTTRKALEAILERQGNQCALCGEAWKGWNSTIRLHIDHDHTTGRVRGFLCGDCNTALGRFGDDPARLRKAIAYLEQEPI